MACRSFQAAFGCLYHSIHDEPFHPGSLRGPHPSFCLDAGWNRSVHDQRIRRDRIFHGDPVSSNARKNAERRRPGASLRLRPTVSQSHSPSASSPPRRLHSTIAPPAQAATSCCLPGTMSLMSPFPGMDLSKMDAPTLTLLGAAGCVMLSMHFTVQLVSQHLFYWKNPKEQKAILIIVLMAPLYAISSFVGLLDIQGSKTFFTFLEAVKECYEALVIAKFMALMYSYLNISISKNIVPDEIKGRVLHHSFPVSLFLPRTVRLEHKTLKLLKYWTWQFVVIRPVCSVLIIALQLLGMYPSWVSWTFTIILNFSVSMALYALVLFYHLFAKELAPHKPLAKFLCIKGIVFFSFWQGIALDILTQVGVIRSHHFWLDVEHIQEAIQNVLVILEMVVFSVIQQYAYHVAPYSGADRAKFEKKNE